VQGSEERELQSTTWYVRRSGQVRGPFPAREIRRLVTLGRILSTDELSRDARRWQPLASLADLLPSLPAPAAPLPQGPAGPDAAASPGRPAQPLREPGGRPSQLRLLEELRHRAQPARSAWAALALILVLAFAAGVWLRPPPGAEGPRCGARPTPGVNWSNCRMDGLSAPGQDLGGAIAPNAGLRAANLMGTRLEGADLAYADLAGSNLSYARLSGARLTGANLQGADLVYADLRGADLSFADLTRAQIGGAILTDARLANARWPDGRECAPGSVGGCLRP
jgi:hypothetical protein